MTRIAAAVGAVFAGVMLIALGIGGHLHRWEQFAWVSFVLVWCLIAFVDERRIDRLKAELEAKS